MKTREIFTFVVVIFLLIYIIISFAVKLDNMKQRALAAEARIVQLKQAVKWVSILEQILPELAKDELNLLDEQLRQRKKE